MSILAAALPSQIVGMYQETQFELKQIRALLERIVELQERQVEVDARTGLEPRQVSRGREPKEKVSRCR